MRLLHPADVHPWSSFQANAEDVFAVGREVMTDGDAATRSERQALADAILLHEILGHVVGLERRADRGVAEGEAPNLAGRREVPLSEQRRERQHAADVVETETRIVGRKEGCRVDIDREQIPDRVAVFRAGQPPDGRPAGVRLRRGRAVECRFEVPRHGVEVRLRRSRHACRRHGAAPQLPHDLLPCFGCVGDARKIQRLDATLPCAAARWAVTQSIENRAVGE